MTTFGPILEL